MSLAAFCAATLASAAPSQATLYRFVISGSQTIKFVLDSSPTPPIVDPGNYFVLTGVNGTINNVASTFDLGFGSSAYFANFGLLNSSNGTNFTSTGVSLFTGSENAPTFKLGTFALNPGYSITISNAPTGVPEPTGWALMITGFGTLGLTLRRRRDNRVRVSYAG